MKKLLLLLPLMFACTPREKQLWLEWYADDPTAAVEFALNLQDDEVSVPAPEYSVWDELAECESGGDWSISTGNGYYGGLQFALGSWGAVGGIGYPHEASREEQIYRAELLQDMQGWDAWPTCSRIIGLL